MKTVTEQPVFWAVRGTLNGEDVTIVVEADTPTEAEYFGWKRGIPVVIVEQARPADVEAAREARLLWRYTRPETRYRCMGQAVTVAELGCLMLCGVWVALVDLRIFGMLPQYM
jgi:hypothetical protein